MRRGPCASSRAVGCLVEHGGEGGGVVREAAEEQAVDGVAEFGEQAGPGRAAVDDGAAGAVGVRVERRPQRAGDGAMWRGGAGSAAPIAQTGS